MDTATSSGSLPDTDRVRSGTVLSAVPTVPSAPPSQPVDTAAAATVPSRSGHRKTSAPPPKCPKCGSGGKRSRNLVVCIDGTSNQFSKKNTNVVELYSRLVKDGTQLTFYNSGIGTYAKPSWKSLSYRKQVIANKLDLAFALRFEKIIISAYAWLVDNYQEGDRIFLFGFSRGAYQVRALAAMIDTVGLLHKGNNDQIPFAYELYAASGKEDAVSSTLIQRIVRTPWVRHVVSRTEPMRRTLHDKLRNILPMEKDRSAEGNEGEVAPSVPFPASRWRGKIRTMLDKMRADKPREIPRPKPQSPVQNWDGDYYTLQRRFKDTFSREVGIHFVGTWDTVSSVGFVRDRTLPGTTDGMQSVCYFRHALALHEYRVKFLPEYANGGNGPSGNSTLSQEGRPPHTKEVWFTGSHSDIGGGSAANRRLDQFGPSLRWMSREATIAGLKFEDRLREWVAGRVSQSMTPIWRLIECLPIKRLSYRGPHSVSWRPHLCADRRIQKGQLLHETVYDECDTAGLPTFVQMEPDDYTRTKTLVLLDPVKIWQQGTLWTAADLSQLETLLSSQAATQTLEGLAGQINRSIWDMARFCQQQKETNPERAASILEELSLFQERISHRTFDLQDCMSPLSRALGTRPTDTYVTSPFFLHGHSHTVTSVAFLSPRRLVSGSLDRALRIWDIETGDAVGDPLTGHTDGISCLAVSPDGSLVASGAEDQTIRIWKFDAGNFAGDGIVMQARHVLSLAFSPDGRRLVSGSKDGALRVWDAATGRQVGRAMEGHGGWVRSVAFSPDGARVASGANDKTVRLWDARACEPLGAPLTGHTGYVSSVAFSPTDGLRIASASWDGTVRVWNPSPHSAAASNSNSNSHRWELAHTLAPAPAPARRVWCVAWAPGGRHVAAASEDNTVRVWDAVSGAAVGVLRGHTDWVYAVAFSADGARVASGSRDDTVRVWDRVAVTLTDSTELDAGAV